MNDLSSSLRRTIVAMLTACMIGTLSIPSFATTVDEAQAKITEAEQSLSSVNKEISNIKAQQEELQVQINELDAELVEILINIDITESEIADKEAELEQDNAELEIAEVSRYEQYNSMKDRICYMYENGNISVLDSLLGENSFAQILNKVQDFEIIYGFDRGLLDEYIQTCQEIETLIDNVENDKAELETLYATLTEQQNSLEAQKEEKNISLSNFDQKLAEAESLAEQYSTTISEMEKAIAVEQEAIAKANAAAAEQKVVESSEHTESYASDSGISCTCEEDYNTESAETVSEESATVSSSYGTGSEVANYACQFVGNPYVWGGTSLTNGCDCSGFVMSVYAHFGVSLPHSSSALRSVGYEVSESNLQPGDIICYSGHCAIYIGGGQIVHASNSQPYPAGGIKISSNYAYRTIVAIRRIF